MSNWEERQAAEERLESFFDRHSKEYLKFERIENKRSTRPDLHAFLLLEELAPAEKEGQDMVCAAEHDIIYLVSNLSLVAKNATDEQLLELHRCGVMISEESLAMFA